MTDFDLQMIYADDEADGAHTAENSHSLAAPVSAAPGPSCVETAEAPIESSMRPNCRHPEACRGKTPGKHCRSCAMAALNRNPALNERRQQTRLSQPHVVAKLKATCVANAEAWRSTPEGRKTLTARARENIRRAHTPEAAAKRRAVAKRGGARCTLVRVPDLPENGVEQFRFLTRVKKLPSADAVRMIRESTPGTPEHSRREIAKVAADMRAKEARRKAQAY